MDENVLMCVHSHMVCVRFDSTNLQPSDDHLPLPGLKKSKDLAIDVCKHCLKRFVQRSKGSNTDNKHI